ncbi:Sialin [Portunus trituberculatus]|uniref:Sialin n=1 Tax=Portunus trituberculatus TaxID=210409 RepID=A0A5B7K461_PORTR|nr:Sialin [Portunus trituberculatus]
MNFQIFSTTLYLTLSFPWAALYVSAAGLVAMIWVECDPVWAIIVMCLSVSATGPINSGSALSEQDIAPNFAGTLKGLTNTLGSATGFLAPAVTGAIIKNNVSSFTVIPLLACVFRNAFPSHYDNFPRPQTQVAEFLRQFLLLKTKDLANLSLEPWKYP